MGADLPQFLHLLGVGPRSLSRSNALTLHVPSGTGYISVCAGGVRGHIREHAGKGRKGRGVRNEPSAERVGRFLSDDAGVARPWCLVPDANASGPARPRRSSCPRCTWRYVASRCCGCDCARLGPRCLGHVSGPKRPVEGGTLCAFPCWERATAALRVQPNTRCSSYLAPKSWQAR